MRRLAPYWRYLWYVVRHKVFVFRACQQLGIPWRGVLHDLSKFRPDEFGPYAWSFYGPWSYKDRPAEVVAAFDRAWLAHIHRNAHHPQHFFLRNDQDGDVYLPMPERYVREMVADWLGAGMAIKGHGWAQAPAECMAWWDANKDRSGYAMHPRTRALVDRLLDELQD